MEELSFEDAMKKLEDIANELEKDDLSLDESVKKFQEGMNLSKECRKALKEVEESVKVVMDEDSNGNIVTSDLKTNE